MNVPFVAFKQYSKALDCYVCVALTDVTRTDSEVALAVILSASSGERIGNMILELGELELLEFMEENKLIEFIEYSYLNNELNNKNKIIKDDYINANIH